MPQADSDITTLLPRRRTADATVRALDRRHGAAPESAAFSSPVRPKLAQLAPVSSPAQALLDLALIAAETEAVRFARLSLTLVTKIYELRNGRAAR